MQYIPKYPSLLDFVRFIVSAFLAPCTLSHRSKFICAACLRPLAVKIL